ncbi:Alpha/beta hydrolase fold-3 [Cordyceps fumosorosea ARSEF 2679]|uniref:Alpha/beta hydrolase fold-3 n=1 Tax=Cordyceps fumosorosea (strain ARSEF 2679) TaxID=1081104 RepID=A0A162MEU7_CORFA|nr:Alpha/beta hydrolase fold-3 [Cordyceps fumosorosea ARSEF 2679]OAA55190.1 Alpha/beta hydrolase fold-3 [Cordyceps fumosorosea ARSEF 2679]
MTNASSPDTNEPSLINATPCITVARALFTFASRTVDSSSLQWRQKLSISLLQALRRTLNPRHTFAHSRQRLTGAAVEAYCRTRGLSYAAAAVDLPNNPFADSFAPQVPRPTLHVVTPADAPVNGPTLLYAHGGGYLNPLQAPGHMPFALRCATSCGAARVVLIEYALTSEHPYPAQLIQMVAATKHLLNHPLPGADGDVGVRPRDLILAGDSAGGHLLASLLAHVARPSPYAPPLTELGTEKGRQLRAVALFSPWMGMTTTDASFTANHETDYLSAQQMDVFIRLFEPPSPAEVWASPIEADDAAAVWKAAFPRAAGGKPLDAAPVPLARRMLITSGAGETLFDSCVKFARELLGADMVVLDSDDKVALVAGKELVFTMAPDEAHVQPVLDSALGYPNGWSMKAVDKFLQSTKQ